MSGCSALDALEREYEAVVRQKPITPVTLDATPPSRQKSATDGGDVMEEGQEYDDLQSICSYAATCDDDLERERMNSDDENQDYDYEPLQEDDWENDEEDDEEKPAALNATKKWLATDTQMSENDKEAIKKAMQGMSLRPPSWGNQVTDDQLVELVEDATKANLSRGSMEP